MDPRIDNLMLRFFREDLGGIRITDKTGATVYEDEKSAFVRLERTNWTTDCPPCREGQRGEKWDLVRPDCRKTYMVITSTVVDGDWVGQIHHLVDTSVYTELCQDITRYSRKLLDEKDRDGLTGLYNKGKFMALTQSLFRGKDTVTVFNMDVNDLKQMNDTYGHDAGDKLILKAAESLHRIEARNVMAFRVGGDEFIVVALHLSLEGAQALRQRWEEGLAELNRADDGIRCVIACGMAWGGRDYVLEEVLSRADRLMYEDKRAKKAQDRT